MDSNDEKQSNWCTEKMITFPGKDHLTNAVVEGTFRYYLGDKSVFVAFLLAEPDGSISACYARGERDQDPMGECFTRWMNFPTLEAAESAFAILESKASEFLKDQVIETNSTVGTNSAS